MLAQPAQGPRVSALAAQWLLSTLYPVGSLGLEAAPRWNGVGGQKAGAGGFLGSRLSTSQPLSLSVSLSSPCPPRREAGHLGNPLFIQLTPVPRVFPSSLLQGQDWISQGEEPAGPARAAQKDEAEPSRVGWRGRERGGLRYSSIYSLLGEMLTGPVIWEVHSVSQGGDLA